MYTTTPHPTIIQNHQPTADGTAGEPYNGFVHETITFDGSRSYDRDGAIISWLWSYGDGTTATGAITTHAYNHTGDYPVSLTVTDNTYASDTYTTTAHITQGNNPPTTPDLIGPTIGHANIPYDYLLVATDPDNDTIRYIINWDDNHTDTSLFFASGQPTTLTHQWDTYGFYTIQSLHPGSEQRDLTNHTNQSCDRCPIRRTLRIPHRHQRRRHLRTLPQQQHHTRNHSKTNRKRRLPHRHQRRRHLGYCV